MRNFFTALWRRFLKLVDISEFIDVEAASRNIRDNVSFRGPNIIILFCAITIASLGLNVNSIPVIIGAMLISPLMSPILGFSLGLGTNDTDLLRFSLKNLGIMVGISILASTLFFLLSPLDMENPTELLARTNPTIYDVLIALFGGFAGIIEISRKEKGTVMSGVAIATALMPPLCTVGYGIASWQWSFAVGALYLFVINGIFIALAGYFGTLFLRYPVVAVRDPKTQTRNKTIVIILLIVMLIPSVISGYRVIKANSLSRAVNSFVAENKNIGKSYIYDYTLKMDTTPAALELFIAGEQLSADEYEQLYRSAEAHKLTRGQLIFRLDATRTNEQLSDRDIMQEILRSNDNKLKASDMEIRHLKSQVDSLRKTLDELEIPATQLEQEISTQYTHVDHVQLGRTTQGGVIMIVYADAKHALTNEQMKQLEAWLKVRLNTTEGIVVQQVL